MALPDIKLGSLGILYDVEFGNFERDLIFNYEVEFTESKFIYASYTYISYDVIDNC